MRQRYAVIAETAPLKAAQDQSRRNRAKRRQRFLRAEHVRRDRSRLHQCREMEQPESRSTKRDEQQEQRDKEGGAPAGADAVRPQKDRFQQESRRLRG